MPENLDDMPVAKKRPWWHVNFYILLFRALTISFRWATGPITPFYIGLSVLGLALLGFEFYWPKKHRRFAPFVSIFILNFALFVGLYVD